MLAEFQVWLVGKCRGALNEVFWSLVFWLALPGRESRDTDDLSDAEHAAPVDKLCEALIEWLDEF